VNVFADSHHSDIRDRDVDERLVSKTAIIWINLSCIGSKSQLWLDLIEASFNTCRGSLRQYHLVRMRLRRRHSSDGNRQVREPEQSWYPSRSRNSETGARRISRKIATDCKK